MASSSTVEKPTEKETVTEIPAELSVLKEMDYDYDSFIHALKNTTGDLPLETVNLMTRVVKTMLERHEILEE